MGAPRAGVLPAACAVALRPSGTLDPDFISVSTHALTSLQRNLKHAKTPGKTLVPTRAARIHTLPTADVAHIPVYSHCDPDA